MSEVAVVGAGITGATAAHRLRELGHGVTVYEAESAVGGNLRTATMGGVRYEPHGPHIFHTSDEEVWQLVDSLVAINDYRHRVRTVIPGSDQTILAWPPQVDELKRLPEWPVIARELDALPPKPSGYSFETYAVNLMGPTLYQWFCEGYTWKQWGVDPAMLSSSFAPRRIDLRTDGNLDLFRDRHQGYLARGWELLVERLLRHVPVKLGLPITVDNLPDADGYVVTAALDDFLNVERLPWRGIRSEPRWLPAESTVTTAAAVVNYSDRTVPWTRVVDTRRMTWPGVLDFSTLGMGQVLVYEYPGAPVRHYPVDDVAGENRERHAELSAEVMRLVPNVVLAGRLARYVYVDMDAAMRQGLNAARSLHRQLTRE